MPVINTNVNALFAQSALRINNRNLSSAMEQLSSGSRVNSAKDDAAGIAIGSTMTAQIRGLGQAVRNANDAVNMLQTTATNSTAQQSYLDKEFQALTLQISDIATQTKWNGSTVLLGASGNGASADQYNITVGSGGTGVPGGVETVSVTIADMSSLVTGSIATTSGAKDALGTIDTALNTVNASRAVIGAGINRLTYAADNLNNVIQNATASRSQVLDTDYATATTQLARSQIIQQAATAMLAQANQQPQTVLALLK
jgi:flagellin